MNPDIVAGLMIGGFIFSMAASILGMNKPVKVTTPVALLISLIIAVGYIAGTIYLYQT